MKKLLYAVLSLAAFAGTLVSCSDNDDTTTYYKLSVSLEMPEGVSAADFTSASVVVINSQTGREYSDNEIKSDYSFELPGGTYSVTAALRVNDGGSVVSYSASKSVPVYEDTPVTLELTKSVSGGLIFKEVYYNMVKPNGKMPYMRDQFFEIYNNSDEVLYLDNCILGFLEGSQGKLPTAWQENGEIMKEYALGYYTVAFVSQTGKDYPLEPGKSVVIAGQAQNHIAETEKMYEPNDGAMISPVNLFNADYEVFLGDYKPAVSVDNASVPNLTVICAQGTQNYFSLPMTGNAIIFAKLPDGVSPVDYAKNDANFKERPDGSYAGQKYLMIPQEYVLDGLNIVNNADKPDQRVIRLRSEIDAGIVYMEKPYAGKSIRRKVESITEAGRVIFKDTNNSTEDFLRDQTPTPGIIPTVVD
ncbi:DUF4876 domain-containing protein [uncultured Muribaculum sp.]|jgi:hypothetical protein|uniref:DUF4876 domain-containing protein n=1 Tax=uncultured Muribaculum sp. TaxID=1918613 RepID=UPI0025B11126|nr:DUF4876 domain-containing protein [uncultured Muribaculum sp.]